MKKFILLLFPAAFLASAMYGLVTTVESKPMTRLAAAIERGFSPSMIDDALLTKISSQVVRAKGDCTLARTNVTAALFVLRHRPQPQKISAFRDLSETVDFALSCNPLDGNLWLLKSLVQKSNGDSSGFVDSWRRSIATSPLEGKVLDLRWTTGSPLIVRGELPVDDAVEADLINELKFAEAEQASLTLSVLRRGGQVELANRALAEVSQERQKVLEIKARRLEAPTGLKPELSPFRSDVAK